jgi:hypothetical protein
MTHQNKLFCLKSHTRILQYTQIHCLEMYFSCYSLNVNHFILKFKLNVLDVNELIRVAARCKAWICRRSFAGIAGSNPAGGMDVLSRVICCQVEVCKTGRSLVQWRPTECVHVCVCVIECDQVQH